MPLSDLKPKDFKDYPKLIPKHERKKVKEFYSGEGHEPHTSYFYAFLGLIYDGVNTIESIKVKLRLFFNSSTKQLVVEEDDVEEYLQAAKRKNLISINQDESIIELTEDGKKLVEICYLRNLHVSYWMNIIFSKRTVLIFSALVLVLLSFLKILTGIQLGSQGMITDGFENLTDLIKIGIIVILGLKLNKDKLASVIITLMMIFTGIILIWSSIEALLNPSPIIPTAQAYVICFLSIALNTGLMYLKSFVGRRSGNLSLLSDSKDSGLNILISVGVLIGLTFALVKYYFVDAIVGLIIGILIFKEGIEILKEVATKDKDFDISAIKVRADNIFDNRLTRYICACVRRERISRSRLLKNFEQGLEYGRYFYERFADYFYDDLGPEIAEKHLNKLIIGKYIDIF